MKRKRLTFACGGYDRMDPLRDGTVTPDGIDLDYRVMDNPREVFDRMAASDEIDMAEYSASQYICDTVRGDSEFVALPVFASRVFRHGFIFVNRASGIREPKDLAGKRIGLGLYTQSACIWIRGHLREHHGVDLSQVEWIEGATETAGPHGETASTPPASLASCIAPNTLPCSLSERLAEGSIDAFFGAKKPSSFGVAPNVQRLFPNYRVVEQQFYRDTGIYPIMHLVVIRRRVIDEAPWIAASLYRAFTEAKDIALRRMRISTAPRYMLPWLVHDVEELDALFGADPWPYGVAANRPTLDAFVRHLADEGLLSRRPAADELFLPV